MESVSKMFNTDQCIILILSICLPHKLIVDNLSSSNFVHQHIRKKLDRQHLQFLGEEPISEYGGPFLFSTVVLNLWSGYGGGGR